MSRTEVTREVAAVRAALTELLEQKDEKGRVVGASKCGVYAFYDYDGEPIYVGQTTEQLCVRIRRHLTNQRTDAVAMSVLDPFEVADVEMWPYFDLAVEKKQVTKSDKATLVAAEYTVYLRVLAASKFKAVLNEKTIQAAKAVELPPSWRGRIVPAELFATRRHPDTRIARRASTIATLARIISERAVSPGLRRTLLTQAVRLERLAAARLEEIGKSTTGSDDDVADD